MVYFRPASSFDAVRAFKLGPAGRKQEQALDERERKEDVTVRSASSAGPEEPRDESIHCFGLEPMFFMGQSGYRTHSPKY